MLETYLSSARTGDAELRSVTEAPMPTRAEDVDKFMAELVRPFATPHAFAHPITLLRHCTHTCEKCGPIRHSIPRSHGGMRMPFDE